MTCFPLTLERWQDFERLFGKNGALGGCWCMWWRISRDEFDRQKGDGNRRAMKAIVTSGVVPGILAYENSVPVGWCSVAPREQYASLNRSPVLKRIDDRPVWSIVCFFVGKEHRGKGIMRQLIQAAVDYAASKGAGIVEAYPAEPRDRKKLGAETVFMGLPGLFRSLGFEVAARPSRTRTIMRYTIKRLGRMGLNTVCDNRYNLVYELVCLIPSGNVATYGQIASYIDRCTPRMVGYAMAATPHDRDIPWHRVINSQGMISIRANGERDVLQRLLLEKEGVIFNKNGKVDLSAVGWKGP